MYTKEKLLHQPLQDLAKICVLTHQIHAQLFKV